jgi:hypothetical protein
MNTHRLLPLILLAACSSTDHRGPSIPRPGRLEADIRAADVQAHVDYLASDELMGRSATSEQARHAAHYVADCFERFGLEPAGDAGGWFQEVDEQLSPNVVGRIAGTGDGYVVLTAHYDHLAPASDGTDRIFNGADDNASGTAVVLELAQAFGARAAAGRRPQRSLLFVAFTAEEMGLRGSRFFVDHLPVEKQAIIGNINMDMVSRGEEDLIFCEPGAQSEHLRLAAEVSNARLGELRIRFGAHPNWIMQSDQYSFVRSDIPAIYFGVEDHEDYHRVSDHADKILPELTARVARLVEGMVGEL